MDWFTDGTIDSLDLYQLAASWLGQKVQTDSPKIKEGFETGDFTAQSWQQGGDAEWTIVSDTVYEGTYAAHSGTITDGQSTTMAFSVDTTGYTAISFAYKVSSESGYDYLRFYIDDVEQGAWSGTVDWTIAAFSISEGTHTLKWEYSKDGSVGNGDDCAWIDSIQIYTE